MFIDHFILSIPVLALGSSILVTIPVYKQDGPLKISQDIHTDVKECMHACLVIVPGQSQSLNYMPIFTVYMYLKLMIANWMFTTD